MVLAKLLGVAAIGLLTANCANQLERQVQLQAERNQAKYGVGPGSRSAGLAKGGGRSMVGNSYRVAGRTYTPTVDPDYTAVGLASWYGPGFHGRRTANGEIFDRHSFAAAHPTLPLPSYVRVTNLANNRSMVVRVNDRGPFHGRRIIDVSQRTAEALEFRHVGTARVKVEYVAPAEVDGSDDDKLLATLDAGDAPGSGNGASSAPVMVASAASEPAMTARPPTETQAAPAGEADGPPPAAASPILLASTASPVRGEGAVAALVPLATAADADAARPGAAAEEEAGQAAALPRRNAPLPPERPGDADLASAGADDDSGRSAVEKTGSLAPAGARTSLAAAAPAADDRNAFAALLKRVAAGPSAATQRR